MARGKFLSLDEARRQNRLDRFAKETPYQTADRERFDALLDAMARGGAPASEKRPAKVRTSRKAKPAD